MSTTDWKDHASCAGTDPGWWFPTDGGRGRTQLTEDHQVFCDACPVSAACLKHALHHERHGIWAGTDEAMRARMRKAMRITLVEIAVDELTATVVHLAEQGTPPAVAEQLGVNIRTVYRHLDTAGRGAPTTDHRRRTRRRA